MLNVAQRQTGTNRHTHTGRDRAGGIATRRVQQQQQGKIKMKSGESENGEKSDSQIKHMKQIKSYSKAS